MKAKTSFRAVGGLVCAALLGAVTMLSGCLPHGRARNRSSPPPASLVERIRDADRIVATNRFGPNFSLSISGQQVNRIIRAVSSARRSAPTDSVFDCDLLFYRDTNPLAKIRFQGAHFIFESDEYYNDTGVLDTLYRDLLKRSTRP